MLLELLVFTGLFVVSAFGWVVIFGAPFVPALPQHIDAAFRLLNLKPGQTLLEIGAGDGRVVEAAASRGITVVGYEINPLLVIYAKLRLRKYSNATVRWRNAWTTPWPPTDAVYIFGLEGLLPKVYTKVIQSNDKSVKLVSVGFPFLGQPHRRQLGGVYLYVIEPTTEGLQSKA